MYKYRNRTDIPFDLPGIGQVGPKGEIITDHVIENPNIEFIGEVSADEYEASLQVAGPPAQQLDAPSQEDAK